VHILLEHRGETLGLVSKTAPPFDGKPGDTVGLQLTGETHLFGGDGGRLASARATLR
jgi:hypothetical protein